MSRPRSVTEVLCDDFRALLTTGFYVTDEHGEVHGPGTPLGDAALAATKAWRGDLWKAFRPIDDSMCPVRVHEREAAKRP
ncbi:hypothetical protein CcrKarma_gp055 [Caulobacter virus Karma]|uniref:Uncharacterized protein n=6 Tax=Viruses TaxID=10239 RepID=K4JPH7_9CAUD|nr:hypothetical protein D865_gp054 [Caulobacter phage phiCbK]YP_006988734.1 hypothetical protein CcrMagneto_gp052 [Caulobacter virus Magneto]YP_006989435.1 hypothetical protein CcrKarma_gp055 [Caulobacter virus Karma]YP_006989785.1 hypothetical protein D870_gp052 [Caulobacter phage CcrSwift]ARB13582.1 hypothetical protein Ccr10_gp054 [Caulobacter phage Ccr10]ARB13928.1 hypothetical protein Ccr2_gp053 [Caulobacter phage Ccr2]ARB14271.1 hypothetical protein Ccr5_gp053 [Caulobacter phage Ccr5]A